MVRIEEILPAITRSGAWSWMQHRYLPDGPVCACGSKITGPRAIAAWHDLRIVYCPCGRRTAATNGTPIAATSWQPEEFLQLIFLRATGQTISEISAVLGKSTATVADMLDRISLWHGTADHHPVMPLHTGIKRVRGAAGEGLGAPQLN